MIKVLYGCCYKAEINDYGVFDITYIDIIPDLTKSNGRYICKDIREVNFNDYDIIILTPPCNYYSRANWHRETSSYSQMTKDLLPYCVRKCNELNKPFIIENVRSSKMFNKIGLLNYFYYIHGRHTYWSNYYFNIYAVNQVDDNIHYISSKDRQGGKNVNDVFNEFLKLFIYDTSPLS